MHFQVSWAGLDLEQGALRSFYTFEVVERSWRKYLRRMRISFPDIAAVAVVSLLMGSPLLAADEAEQAPPEKAALVWQNDEMCQFVFFAVLEGLYRDGIQNEVVDAIIGDLVEKEEDKVKTHFVFRCELCHATYEAFRTYRNRPAFMEAGGQSTFGKGADLKILKELKSEKAKTRVYAMGRLVRPWIMHRIDETRKTAAEKTEMKESFEKYAREGRKLMEKYTDVDPLYVDWSFYGSCQACEAAEDLGDAGF